MIWRDVGRKFAFLAYSRGRVRPFEQSTAFIYFYPSSQPFHVVPACSGSTNSVLADIKVTLFPLHLRNCYFHQQKFDPLSDQQKVLSFNSSIVDIGWINKILGLKHSKTKNVHHFWTDHVKMKTPVWPKNNCCIKMDVRATPSIVIFVKNWIQ